MLEELIVQNYALIDSLSLSFEQGFNVLTGETGAGKSIIVGSLSFLLGAKAGAEVIRSGADEARVSAVVSLGKENQDALDWLTTRDIALEDDRFILRRTVKRSGRGSISIQQVPVTRRDLAELMAFLFDLHGQHTHESLLRRETHRRYLDRFAGLERETLEFNRLFLNHTDLQKRLEAQVSSERDRNIRLEVLNYTVTEISKAAPQKGESRELESEAQRLGDFEKLSGQVNAAAAALFEDDLSVLGLARRARTSLESAAAIDEELSPVAQRMEDLYYEAEDLAAEFRAYREGLRYDPERLEAVEARLALLYRLKKKYGPDEEAILDYQAKALAEIEALAGVEEHREKLKAEIALLENAITSRAGVISARRTAAAQELSTRITGILADLGMPHARFSVSVSSKGQGAEGVRYGPWGADEVEFLIAANIGEPLKELSRIASGGELSRVMLAIKTVLSEADTLETLVFDEIDTGIGGAVALSVGEYLARIGVLKQIFCVTHLASIAVRADNHLKVEKKTEAERTITTVVLLEGDTRRHEIARMLAGDAGAAALAHADALLAKYGHSAEHGKGVNHGENYR
ncbi:MAG: DNA repair protein RecN [Treponema sp.]|jgi:DNA repair protein RecN (Recombination protein N)|nr:DNA repair protein RecN [Treponema sp.]